MSAKEYYEKLLEKALLDIENIKDQTKHLVMVCGPLRGNDGKPCPNKLECLKERISHVSRDLKVFDQTPYEESHLENPPHDIDTKMEVFFKGLILSGEISKLYILPGWEESEGTQKEISYAKLANVPVEYLK
jgi:hypothetical protein